MAPKFVGSLLLLLVIFGSAKSKITTTGIGPYGAPAPSCMDVKMKFMSCTAYIDGMVARPPAMCCMGLMILNAIAKMEKGGPSRICSCIEAIADKDPRPFNETRIKALYTICKIHLSFPISEHQNCSAVTWKTGGLLE